ncbi:unnamed protein product [Alopecurus aequalis]
MSSSSSRATSRIEIPARMEMPIFLCPRCRADVDQRVSRTPKNRNHLFYVCHDKGVRISAILLFSWSGSLSNCTSDSLLICLILEQVTCFFLWVDVLAQKLLNVLLAEHEEWLPMLPGTEAAASRAPEDVEEGATRNDREVAVELRRLNQKIRKLEDQAQIPICNYIWAFVGMAIALVEMLKLYGKA